MNNMRDLPNEYGFKFIGITHDDDRVPCHVGLNPVNMHDVYRDDDKSPFFCHLTGWERLKEAPDAQ